MPELTEWVQKLTDKKLPIFQHTIDQLQQIEDNPATTLNDYNEVVLNDPGLITQIIKKLNTNPTQNRVALIRSMDHAGSLLGISNIIQMASKMPTIESVKLPESLKNRYQMVASRAVHSGVQAQDWEVLMNYRVPQEALVAGQLRYACDLAIWAYGDHNDLIKIDALLENNDTLYETAYIEVLGFSMNQLGQELAKNWLLPDVVIHSFSTDDEKVFPRSKSIYLAGQLVEAVEMGWESDATLDILSQVSNHIHVTPEETMERVMNQSIVAAQSTDFIKVDHPGQVIFEQIPESETSL
ncbi:MAG: HDOD domain-containing protein [Methylococcales bacterium]|nr:HDOD domain-containing protein [Methylococcales bacterium]MBT7410914.1 HDOD domain-containing protein [Methylococcales bacterium]